jgi:dolichol-phosphate mannosyltransferase
MVQISVVTPVYGCRSCLDELCYRLKEALEKITFDFEIILVNDASPDEAWETIVEISQKDKRVKGLNLSRNFGQHNAITAGLDHSKGEWVVVMDCDLQDQPEEIINLYNKAQEGFDIVFAKRMNRKDGFFKTYTSRIFYGIFNFLTDIKPDFTIANFGIYSNISIKEYLKFKESFKVFPILIRLIGFRNTAIEVMHGIRPNGKSSYNYLKLIKLALKIVVSHSNKPLYISIYLGFFMAMLSFLYSVILILRYFSYNVPLGYTSIILTILFIGGLILIMLGILGIYLGKIFDQVKERPLYIIKQKTF